jgi:hypothetical protein
MSLLATELKPRGIQLVDPLQASPAKALQAGVTFDNCKEDGDFDNKSQIDSIRVNQTHDTPSFVICFRPFIFNVFLVLLKILRVLREKTEA